MFNRHKKETMNLDKMTENFKNFVKDTNLQIQEVQ